eukprot:TRINITY_DN2567_c0_g1_i1.p1 TRINITY_DN2567_c0_g1~~TRINITY_DN2567_c0_g1_i1.p1  ORF type:complete len:565 (-),score=38.63 TRINITY_DN2567_c0_g1_i1:979-2673(-)
MRTTHHRNLRIFKSQPYLNLLQLKNLKKKKSPAKLILITSKLCQKSTKVQGRTVFHLSHAPNQGVNPFHFQINTKPPSQPMCQAFKTRWYFCLPQHMPQKIKEEIETFTTLRCISRKAYSIEPSVNNNCKCCVLKRIASHEIAKLLGSVEGILKKSKIMCQAESPATKLKQQLLEKQKKLQEIHAIAKEIGLLNSKDPKKANSDKNLGGTTKSSQRNRPSHKRTALRRQSCKNVAGSQVTDFRKLALKNSMRNKTNLMQTPPSKVTFRTTEDSFEEACTNWLKIDFLGQKSKKNADLVAEINNLVSANRPVLTEEFDWEDSVVCSDDDECYGTIHRSYSYSSIPQKLLDFQNEREDADKPDNKRRHNSFAEELLESHEYEKDPRVNNSCVLDSLLRSQNEQHIALRRTNSLELNRKPNVFDDSETSIINSKKYFSFLYYLSIRISIEDFKIIKGISSGAYGKVCLVQKISSGDYFAMKIIDRQKTVEKEQEGNIQREVDIMRKLNTDYVVKLYYSFQNETHLFFVMEYMNGGDLGSLLSNIGLLSEGVSLFLCVIRVVCKALSG